MSSESTEISVHEEAAAYSFGDQSYARDPFSLWERFRDTPGLVRSEQDTGFWIAARYEEVRQVATQEKRFCARNGRHVNPHPGKLLPSDADGAEHRKYRRLLTPWMTDDAVDPLEGMLRETCAEMLEPLAQRTSFDMSHEFATPAIVRMGMKWLGWPLEDAADLGAWAHDIMAPAQNASGAGNWRAENRETSWKALSQYIAARLDERRNGEPREDIIQTILDAEIDGRPITDDEVMQMMLSVFLGAVDTTGSTLAESMYYLANNPEARDLLRAEPDRLPLAVEEFLRVAPTIVYLARSAVEDTELEGCPVKQGDRIAMLFSSANRDERMFPNPNEVILDRQPNRHMAFGAGPHKCAGTAFARMMLRVAIQEALEKLGDFEVADESKLEWELTQMRIWRRLPVTHTPR